MISNVPYETHLVALREIGNLQATIADLRSQLEAAEANFEAGRAENEAYEHALEAAFGALLDPDRPASDLSEREKKAADVISHALELFPVQCPEKMKREEMQRERDVWREKAWKHAEEVTEAEREKDTWKEAAQLRNRWVEAAHQVAEEAYGARYLAEWRLGEALAALGRALVAGILEDFGSPSPSEQARAVLAAQTEEKE